MNYWITAHWPPYRTDPNNKFRGVYLPNGREVAGRDLRAGDRVLIYEALSGPDELYEENGQERRLKRVRGVGGIAAIAEVQRAPLPDPESRPARYSDGKEIWWRFFAPVRILSRSGYVPRTEVNRVLGYPEHWSMNGFGDYHSGLKRLTSEQYHALESLFKASQPIRLPPPPVVESQIAARGRSGGGEGEPHRTLKKFVASDPVGALGVSGLRTLGVEYPFCTNDRADLVLADEFERIIGVEVETDVLEGQLEGVLQAVKYRFMLEVVSERRPGDSRAFLIAYSIAPSMRTMAATYGIECFSVDRQRVEEWSRVSTSG